MENPPWLELLQGEKAVAVRKKRTVRRKKDSRLKRVGVSGYNKPKRTPNHRTKSHVVVAKVGNKELKLYDLGNKGCQEQENLQNQRHKENAELHSKLVTPKI